MSRRTRNLLLLALFLALVVLAYVFYPARGLFDDAAPRAREAVLKTNLHTLRDAIHQFHGDRQRYPSSLDELVEAGYLRKVPIDPFTRSGETWRTTRETQPASPGKPGIVDVHSGARGKSLGGMALAKL